MRISITFCAWVLFSFFFGSVFGTLVLAQPPVDALSLKQAEQRALAANPELKAFAGEIKQAKARLRQAGLYPNPNLNIESEGIVGSGPETGMDGERTFGLEQEILLGGKIEKRRRVAAGELESTAWEMRILQQDILKGVRQAFIEVAGAQESVALQRNLVELAGQVYETVRQRADAGKISPVEAIKAEIELKNSRQALQVLERQLAAARKTLAAFWGTSELDFEKVVTDSIDDLPEIPSIELLEAALRENPDIERFEATEKYRKARYELEKAERIPNVTIGGGYRQIPETDDNAVDFSISIPLNIFDRNQGNIEAAREGVLQVDDLRASAVNARRRELNAAYENALALNGEIISLREEIIPATQEVFAAKEEGYRSGKFSYLELLDAQRVLFESRQRYNDAIAAYHRTYAEIERLTGKAVETNGSRWNQSRPGSKGDNPS